MSSDARASLLGAGDREIVFSIVPEALVTRWVADAGGGAEEVLELTAHFDDRVAEVAKPAAVSLRELSEIHATPVMLHWGAREVPCLVESMTVTETAFGAQLQPVAAKVDLSLRVKPTGRDAAVFVAGDQWRQVDDLRECGPDDQVYRLRIDDTGGARIRFGNGKRGRRPPAGAEVRASYQIGGGRSDH